MKTDESRIISEIGFSLIRLKPIKATVYFIDWLFVCLFYIFLLFCCAWTPLCDWSLRARPGSNGSARCVRPRATGMKRGRARVCESVWKQVCVCVSECLWEPRERGQTLQHAHGGTRTRGTDTRTAREPELRHPRAPDRHRHETRTKPKQHKLNPELNLNPDPDPQHPRSSRTRTCWWRKGWETLHKLYCEHAVNIL